MKKPSIGDPERIGLYQVAGRLGAGGMGVVYLGTSPTADLFAIKVISPALVSDQEFRARFAAEVETLRTVIGNRVARLERADLDADPPWLATVFVPGRSLQTQVETVGPLDERSGAMLGALLVEGLRHVHEAGLVHRDLKPANIMLGPDGPTVIDFGLAVLRERTEHLTGTGQPVGTLNYMSPEQARGTHELTTATDVYALGASLVYALAGHTIYQQANPIALLKRIDDPTDLPDTSGVPAQLVSLVNSMLGYEPSSRPDLDTVYRRLVEVATAGGVTAEAVRADLARHTYVDEHMDLPPWTDDPTADDSDLDPASTDPTRLVSWPPDQPPVPSGPVASGPEAPEPEPAPRAKPDLAWLVEEMRTTYAREAAL